MITRAKTHLRRLLPKNAFARGVSVLVGGTAGAQLLTILAAPVLTRLYGPEDFGLVAVYGSLLALIGVIASLRYELAIPLPEDDDEAANVAALSLILVGVSTLLTGVLVLQLRQPIVDVLGVSQLAGYLWLLPVGVLLGGAYNVFNYWSVRTKRFGAIAETKIRQSLTTIAIQLTAFKLGGLGLLLAQVAGQSVGTTSLGRPALASAGFKQVSLGGILRAGGRYRRFPIFSTWAGFANTAGLQLPPMLFAALFSSAAAGIYALAHRVLILPMSLVGGAIGQVFFGDAARMYRTGELGLRVTQLHAKLAHIGFPPAFILMAFGPDLFSLIFGQEWYQAGELARWMSPWLYFQFIASPLSAAIFSATGNQQYMLSFQIVMLFLRVLGILIGFLITDFVGVVMIFSIASSASYLFLLVLLIRLSGASLGHLSRSAFYSLCLSVVVFMPVLLAQAAQSISPYIVFTGIFFSISMVFWYYWSALRDEQR